MDPIIPETGELARYLSDILTVNHTLQAGTWSYPDTRAGDVNISFFFDLILISGLFLIWGYQVIFAKKLKDSDAERPSRRDDQVNMVAEYCMKGARINSVYLTTGVEFITKDEYATLLALFVVCALTFFKIIGGAERVNAGYVFVVVLTALFVRFTRQAGKQRVAYMLVTFLAFLGVIFAFMAYTETFSEKKEMKRDLNIVGGAFLAMAALGKIVLTLRPDYASVVNRGSTYEAYVMQRSNAMVDGEYVYELSGMTVIVVGASLMTFFFTEAVTVAISATKWYALPFYALYAIPIYAMVMLAYNAFKNGVKTGMFVMGFNLMYVYLGTFILIMLQGHACSLPSDKLHEYSTGNNAYCPRFGGLKKSTEDGLKLHVGWTITLEIFSAIFILMTYMAMIFSSISAMRNVSDMCNSKTYMTLSP